MRSRTPVTHQGANSIEAKNIKTAA